MHYRGVIIKRYGQYDEDGMHNEIGFRQYNFCRMINPQIAEVRMVDLVVASDIRLGRWIS
jgi:hypothetical protein